MVAKLTLRALVLELRHELEADLERRLASIGVRRERPPVPVDELPHLCREDVEARHVVDAFLKSRGQAAIQDFIREAAYTWANRLLALRCLEARGLIDEVILQKDAYGGRSLQHYRLARKQPERCSGEDEGLYAVLFDEFKRRAGELPQLFDPKAPEVALRPSVAALKRCIGLLSGTEIPKGQEAATDEVFMAPDALGWAYQFWNTEEKDQVFEKVRTQKGTKIEGAEIIPASCIYTEPYIVKFLVQNSLGALWMGMYPDSRLSDAWEYFVHGADRVPVAKKPVREITFLDPACGSGHFLIEAFELFYGMYQEEGEITEPAAICASILENNLHGIDIDGRAIQIAALALLMKAKEKAPDFVPRRVNLAATNIHLSSDKDHLDAFLRKHPEDQPLKPALLEIFRGLQHADELGSLIRIEQPVEKELRYLWGKDTERGLLRDQAGDPEAWKRGVLARLREHFETEANAPDLSTAFFGRDAEKGLTLVDLLARRYDVVATNPPYMGSKNMAAVVKSHVEGHFQAGKRDLYAAFILRAIELAKDGGRVAMVTQQSWMFLRSFADLRSLDDEKLDDEKRDDKKRDDKKRKKDERAFRGVLRQTTIETLAHLGEHAFEDAAAAGAFVVMFVLARAAPKPEHRLTAFRLIGPKSPEEKDGLLRQAVRDGASAVSFKPQQARFLTIPQTPLCYWLRDRFFELLAGRTLGDVASVATGLQTSDDPRFVRFTWEVLPQEWARPVRARRWVPFEKGGGYGKWFGHHWWAVDWEHNGARIKAFPRSFIRNEERYFKEGWTYSYMARGSLGLRCQDGSVFGHKSPGIFPSDDAAAVQAVANCRTASIMARAISASIQLPEGCVTQIAYPDVDSDAFAVFPATCVCLKRWLVALDATERSFAVPSHGGAESLAAAHERATAEAQAVAAVLHALEGISEREVFAAYGIAGDDLAAVLDETGTPAGWFPLIEGYDQLPPLPEGLETPQEFLARVAAEPRTALAAAELTALKARLRALYEAGPGAKTEIEESEALPNDDEEEEEAPVSGARIPIPAETFLEELSQKLEIHPITVYWLLCELRAEGVVCAAEQRRFVEDLFSVMVLRLLGHRWPRQMEAGESPAPWQDRDGIIPLTEGTGEPTLLARVRARLAEDFGPDRTKAIEAEFADIVGKPLSEWLGSEFFRRHISQFRKRPVAWQIESTPEENSGRRGRGRRRAPAFSCLVYYHRLDADLLPKLRSHYVGPLRARLETELSGLEKMTRRTPDQDARRLELEENLAELRAFDARLERVINSGFASQTLEAIAAAEPLDQWTSRDGKLPAPASREAFLMQEQRYDPDLNDGIRVNIAPLQHAGLLAAPVLAAKDVEKAIADRARWRADERRWCREGKLPRPGWWQAGAEQG
ncbi:MAG TPA: DNA methyltransferase [Bryobacteraceae bacterium]|nr:DNA methyltransferase [Bryobacteraceae bacterium]